RFLADDALEGRGTGTRGYDLAAKYMASQFESLGLEPAGDHGTYFQNVPLRSMKPDESKTSFTINRGGKQENLVFRKDYISYGDPSRAESSVEAPVVFVGEGVTAPDQNYDDYRGIDAKGKIVAMLGNAPDFESSLKAHYSSSELKLKNAADHGAVGVLTLYDPVFQGLYSFEAQVRDLSFPGFHWLDPQHQPNDFYPQIKATAILSMDAVKNLFAGSPHSADEVYAAMKAGKPLSFELPMTASIHIATTLQDVPGRNIAARLEGSDPVLKSENVVYTAHLDHLGIGDPVNGDTIYNGALDNASGSAILIEMARAFAHMHPRPRRSIVFVSVTGEEAGLLGSDYFAHYPTVAKNSIVADVNMDEDLMLWPLQDIVAYGAEHSSLDNVVKKAAARLHLVESPDPAPEEVVFIRSDQYSFVKQGIPAIFPVPGLKSSDPKINPAAIFKNWEQVRYHHPQDDMDQPNLDWDAAAKYARFVFLCGYLIAEDPQRPTWNKSDFFGDHYSHAAK
ncbi:MAG TPA: M28 family metallopeptidase, partial [Candidatus Acidoferrum sp.]